MIFIHPGFGKTATTFLQESIFSSQKKINSIGRPYFSSKKKSNFFLCEELKKNLCFYETKVARTLIKKIYKPRMVNILSDETLGNACFKNQNLILRLKEIFPNARIFFTIRNQLDSIKSYYASQGRILKHAPMPFKGRFVKFKDWFDYEVENFPNNFMGIIQYEPLIKQFEKYFGKKNISIFLYEELESNKDDFLGSLSKMFNFTLESVCKDKKNVRESMPEFYYTMYRNTFFRGIPFSKIVPFGFFLKKKFYSFLKSSRKYELEFNDNQLKTLIKNYSKTNIRLSQNYKLNLSKWSYPM